MTLRRQVAMGKGERRTQEALVAALRVRPRTTYRPGQCVLVAKASVFSSLLQPQAVEHARVGTPVLAHLDYQLEEHLRAQ